MKCLMKAPLFNLIDLSHRYDTVSGGDHSSFSLISSLSLVRIAISNATKAVRFPFGPYSPCARYVDYTHMWDINGTTITALLTIHP